MKTSDFQDCLRALLTEELDRNDFFDPGEIESVGTYEEAGVLTRDAGFVIRMGDGGEFQLTIVRSKGGRAGDEE